MSTSARMSAAFSLQLSQLRSAGRSAVSLPSSLELAYFVGGYGSVNRFVLAVTDEAVRRVIAAHATPSELDAGSAIYMLEPTDDGSFDRFLTLLEACASDICATETEPNVESLRDLVSRIEARPLMVIGSPDVRYLRCFIDGFLAAKDDLQSDASQDKQDMLALE